MKSKTSCFNKTIFKKNITHFWPIWLMILLWNLFFLPFMIYNSSMRYQAINDVSAKELAIWRANDILSLVQVFMNPIPIFVFSVIAVMAVFSYLYNGRSANAIHSLPVTRKELFITNFGVFVSGSAGGRWLFDRDFSWSALRLHQHELSAYGAFVRAWPFLLFLQLYGMHCHVYRAAFGSAYFFPDY